MSDDPKAQIPRLPVVGSEAAPSSYVDYLYWAIHATGPAGSDPVVSLTLGRWVELPPAVPTTPATEPERALRQVRTAFVATLAPETLRQMRDGITGVLAAIEKADSPPPEDDPEKLH